MTAPLLRALPLALAAALLAPSVGLASVPEPSNMLLNQDFEVGLPQELLVRGSLLEEPFEWFGSVLPRTLDSDARIAAPPWSATVLSGQRTPNSTTAWVPGAGHRGSPALVVTYDPRDAGVETLTIAQAVGPLGAGSLREGVSSVRFELASTKPIGVRVAVMTLNENPLQQYGWFVSGELQAVTPQLQEVWMALPVPKGEVVGVFAIYLYGGPESAGAKVTLDNVAVVGSRLPVVGEPPTETDVGFGTCQGPFRAATPADLFLPPAQIRFWSDTLVCVAGIMPYATLCVPQPCPAGVGEPRVPGFHPP